MAGANPTRKGMLGPEPVKSLVQKSNALVIIVIMFLLELIVTTCFFMTQICPILPASYKDLKDLDPVIDVLNLDLVSYSGSNARGAEFLQTSTCVWCRLWVEAYVSRWEEANVQQNSARIFWVDERVVFFTRGNSDSKCWMFFLRLSNICLRTQSFCGILSLLRVYEAGHSE